MRNILIAVATTLALGAAGSAAAQEGAADANITDTNAEDKNAEGMGGPFIPSATDAFQIGDVLPDTGDFAYLDPEGYESLPDRDGKLYAYLGGFAYLLDPRTRTVIDVYVVDTAER
ncbi:hypothetical protein B5C34_01135 [Pacificimonas flava]|uniref:Uncharacterized protein n=2 Tax=Pacificimonas TaxID=1960290 RepID=A0A219B1H7_9SPHN|nr:MULTISPECIES: hypothetical protein [Pacificimonas]MBZ6378181.1 hypothetical protein [Pacificimonas aurantium]OWV32191.1 hypothetical protein B5C34_01135 [Pacificimonas flava]